MFLKVDLTVVMDDMDAMFASFMGEVNNQKSNKRKKLEEKAGTPEEGIERITLPVPVYNSFFSATMACEACARRALCAQVTQNLLVCYCRNKEVVACVGRP